MNAAVCGQHGESRCLLLEVVWDQGSKYGWEALAQTLIAGCGLAGLGGEGLVGELGNLSHQWQGQLGVGRGVSQHIFHADQEWE